MIDLSIYTSNSSSELCQKDYPIVWIEKKYYGDNEDLKQDIRDLSREVGFKITKIVTHKSPDNSRNEIVKAYTKTYREIPFSMKKVVKKWLMKISWSKYIVDVSIKISEISEINEPGKNPKKLEGSVYS